MIGEPSEADAAAARLEAHLRGIGTVERATQERRYLRSDLEHLGASVPQVRRAVRTLSRQLDRDRVRALAAALWSRPVHELRLAAVELLRDRVDLLSVDDLPLIERQLREARTWALVDPLAGDVTGVLALREPAVADTLDRWLTAEDFWLRRSALLALLPGLKVDAPGYVDRLVRYADTLAGEREFFLRKAIGWALREAGKRRPDEVMGWLLRQAPALSAVTWREGVKYLPAQQRERVLSAYGRAGD